MRQFWLVCEREAVLVILVVMTAVARPGLVAVTNAGFESTDQSGAPAGWTLVRSIGIVSATVDTKTAHTGAGSVRFDSPVPGTCFLESTPVTMTVGHMYRLSATIRTSQAVSDPTSRYPTAVAATVTMASFPFETHATAVGGTHPWTKSEILFFATQSTDRVRLHFGLNGTAAGIAWFDDVQLEEVEDIGAYVPLETVRWFGPAFRYTDKGWVFVHIEGEPYQRGYQYGFLLSKEIVTFMDKLAIRQNGDSPRSGWNELRTLTDALMLRKYDKEFLDEMKGIADGAAKAGGSYNGHPVDLLDIATVNSAVDIGQLGGALNVTSTPISGRSFNKEEEEANAAERLHKCSSFLANGPATANGNIVFAQLFMWGGYTGVHWDVICDVQPARGHRLVYETFPGGIHSGADFYINDAGIVIGETTVMQTPFNMNGEPQSSRIRRAAQYGSSIDDVVKMLTTNNNGLYTNDWLIGDVRTNEIAILLLGTHASKLWRSTSGEFPGDTKGFYWSVNNAKDPDVRKEYVSNPGNVPFDVVFGNVNRDLSFYQYYTKEKGNIDGISAVNLIATSPINRPHACDGKVTTAEMASHMMFLAHYGKVTLREKMPEKGGRLMPDLPNVIPHLSLGYSVVNPVYIVDRLKGLRKTTTNERKPDPVLADVKEIYTFDKQALWANTVYPATDGDNWFVSGTTAYWYMLNGMASDPAATMPVLRDGLADMNCRLLYTVAHEGTMVPLNARRVYDRFNHYIIPRIRGVYALHQLRLALGNAAFGATMTAVHTRFRDKPMSTAQFLALAEETSNKPVKPIVMPWLQRDDLPDISVTASATPPQRTDGTRDSAVPLWSVTLGVHQNGEPYAFMTTVEIITAKASIWKLVSVSGADQQMTLQVPDKPIRVVFNAGNDIPVKRKEFSTLSNLFDDFSNTTIVYGTGRQIEANHTAALRIQTVVADQFTEIFSPIRQDAEMSTDDLAKGDLIVLGGSADNSTSMVFAEKVGLTLGKNFFSWRGRVFADPDDGLFVACGNPFNPAHNVYLFVSNSALEQYLMTKRFQPLPSWGVFKGEQIVERGYHDVPGMVVDLK
jgi:hypothetical protein